MIFNTSIKQALEMNNAFRPKPLPVFKLNEELLQKNITMKKSKLKEKNKALERRVECLESRIRMIGSLKDMPSKDLINFLINGAGDYMPETVIQEKQNVHDKLDLIIR